jgi:hypothetical protein
MSVKFEYALLTIMSIIGFLSKHDVLFAISVIAQIIFAIKNLPGACYNLKQFKNKVYARMVKKTNKD